MAGRVVVSTLNNDTGVLQTQNGMTGIPKAWVNLDLSSGTSVVRTSFNISSTTRSATGRVTINFTTAMPNANYIVTATGGNTGSTSTTSFIGTALASSTSYNNKTTSACDIWSLAGNNTAFTDAFDVNIAIFSS